MANEISAIMGNIDGNRYSVVMVFPLDPAKIKKIGITNVVPTPSSQLSDTESSIVDTVHKTALDTGESVFRRVEIEILDADTPQSLAQKAKDRYAELAPKVQTAYDKTYKYLGSKISP